MGVSVADPGAEGASGNCPPLRAASEHGMAGAARRLYVNVKVNVRSNKVTK